MKFTKRLNTIFSHLFSCNKFADVGCDHGYCSEFMLKNNLCNSAVISDISAESLKKAEILLADYMKSGRVVSVCCNGLEKVDADCDFVLIAGMGGEEIISILKNGFLPQKLLLQPMKNTPKVREFLINSGYKIILDYTFKDGKFYDLIKAEKFVDNQKENYQTWWLEFGRDNILNATLDFIEKISVEIGKNESYLQADMHEQTKLSIETTLLKLKEIYNVITRNL